LPKGFLFFYQRALKNPIAPFSFGQKYI